MPNGTISSDSSEHDAADAPDRQARAGAPAWHGAAGPASPRPGRIAILLTHRRLPIFLAVLGIVLAGSSLWGGWIGDDDHHRLRLIGSKDLPELSGEPMKMFIFADGNPEHTQRLMDIGVWPWWTMPTLKVAFMRPLSVITHWLDYKLWPESPAMMHAHNLAWFAGLAIAVTFLYRRMHGLTVVAGLAALLYVIDDARGMPVGFIANRNAILAAFFGVMAIIAHDRWRRGSDVRFAFVAPLLLLASLLSAEAGIGTIAYLFAHAVFFERGPLMDRGSLMRRAAVLMPYALVVVGWRVAWTMLDYGIYGIGLYVDPVSEPIRFTVAVMNRVSVLLLSQFFFPPSAAYIVAMGFGYRYHFVIGAAIIVIALGVAIARRIRWDATTRFWTLGMLLAVLPICATFPSDRMLFFVGLGAFALIAKCLDACRAGPARPPIGACARALAITLLVIHVGIAPLVLAVRAYMPIAPRSLLESFYIHLPPDEAIRQQTIVAICAPVPFAAGYLPEHRALAGLPVPAHTRVLAPNDSDFVRVRRLDAHTLSIQPAKGYLRIPTDRLARSRHHPMSIAQRVELAGLTVEIVSLTEDGRPLEAVFRFDTPLEDASLVWLQWEDGAFRSFAPPAIGESVELHPGAPFL